MTSAWWLLVFAVGFTALAIDARSQATIGVPDDLQPIAGDPDVRLPPLTPTARQTRQAWLRSHGVGNLNQIFWLFSLLALACAGASVVAFLA